MNVEGRFDVRQVLMQARERDSVVNGLFAVPSMRLRHRYFVWRSCSVCLAVSTASSEEEPLFSCVPFFNE